MSPDILERIRKLLRLAQDAAATAGEAEAALGRVAHLQRTHGITDEQIRQHVHHDQTSGLRIDPEAIREETLHEAGRLGRWDVWTASACAQAVGCKIYLSGGYKRRVVAYGLAQDIAVAKALFDFAIRAGERAQVAYCRERDLPRSSHDAKAFRDGFCGGLYEAARKATEAAKAEQTPVAVGTNGSAGGALVLVPSNDVAHATATAVAIYAKTRLNLRSGGSRYSMRGGDGYSAGHSAGKATSLSRSAVR